jgi:tetrapyrrole methylase family protein/MazG family protein
VKPVPDDLRSFQALRRVVAALRGPGGCPWDRVQTHRSLRPYLVEEAAEVLAALDEGDPAKLREELGDLLFQVVLHVRLAEEEGSFRMGDVIESVAAKLVRRHPHVFGDADADTPEAVVKQWDELKREERGDRPALAGIPPGLPALAYAQAIQRRASSAGFAFESEEQVWEALEEELAELRSATPAARAEEVGDALFALANLARWYGVDAEDALRDTCRGFRRIFERMEALTRDRGIDLREAALEEKMRLWEEAKASR